jgi:glycosyltransferase involved in cell wall biosynthesis
MEGIGGLRAFGLAKYISSYGWKPIILTSILPANPDPRLKVFQTPDVNIIETWKIRFGLNPKKSLNAQLHIKTKKDQPSVINRLTSLPSEIITYPDEKIGWYDSAVIAGEKILETEQIDAILSSSRPETCHLVAKTLVEKYHVPWVADFRDLWSQNHYSPYSKFTRYFQKKLEIKTIKNASVITTVSQPLVNELAKLHENKKICLIENGFDLELVNKEKYVDQFFKIVHTGDLYHGKRDPSQLFEVIHDLIDKGIIKRDEIKIDFFGYPKFELDENWLQEDIIKHQLQDLVILHGQVSHNTAVAEQHRAQILLLITWNSPEERGVYTGKLFEYLAAQRPILSFGYVDGGVIKDLLGQTHTGIHAGNKEELKNAIMQEYREYKEFGAVQYHGIEAEVMKYSHKEMARKFAKVLETAVGETSKK